MNGFSTTALQHGVVPTIGRFPTGRGGARLRLLACWRHVSVTLSARSHWSRWCRRTSSATEACAGKSVRGVRTLESRHVPATSLTGAGRE